MKLVIGGYAQGKLNYVLQKYDMETSKIWDGEIPENKGEQKSIVVITLKTSSLLIVKTVGSSPGNL